MFAYTDESYRSADAVDLAVEWRSARGFTATEAIAMICAGSVLLALLLPTLGATLVTDEIVKSMGNLRILGEAHVSYASEWNGRQWTVTPDNLTVILNEQNSGEYSADYAHIKDIPPVPLGFDAKGIFHTSDRHELTVPFLDPYNCSLGNFRTWNTLPFANYVNGRVFDKIFWAPRDPTQNMKLQGYMEGDVQWPAESDDEWIYPTYSMALSAQYDPQVYARSGATRPMNLPNGHRSPNLKNATYPDQKTFMLEHYWLNLMPPEEYMSGTHPFFFNLASESIPATLFYDGHTRLMSVREARDSSARVYKQEGKYLDACNPGCFGCSGYWENYAHNGARSEINSYHVFTGDGIMGRDTTENE